MKNNEPLNSSDLSDTRMTAEEYRLYREVLEAAYPKPKRDIKSGVMDAIRADSARSAEDSDVFILPQKNQKKKKKFSAQTFVKWGSLAASIVIIAGVGIKILPSLLSPEIAYDSAAQETYSMTATAAYNSYESAPAGDAPEEKSAADGYLYKSKLAGGEMNGTAIADEDDSVTEEAEEEGIFADDHAEYSDEEAAVKAAVEEVMLEAVAEEEVVEAEEEAAAEEVAEAAAETVSETGVVFYSVPTADNGMIISAETAEAVVPVINCEHTEVFRDSYHEIPSLLIDEVGEDEYYAWANEVTRDDSCAVNIYNFVHHFGISQAMFAMYLSQTDIAYYCDYPIDILYECSAEEADEYYRGGGRYDEIVKDYFEYEFKLALVSEIGTAAYTEWLDEIGCSSVRGWSISQMVQDNSIDAGRFEEIYDSTVESFPEEYDGYELPEYDLAKVYVPNAGIGFALAMGSTGYSADVACRK